MVLLDWLEIFPEGKEMSSSTPMNVTVRLGILELRDRGSIFDVEIEVLLPLAGVVMTLNKAGLTRAATVTVA